MPFNACSILCLLLLVACEGMPGKAITPDPSHIFSMPVSIQAIPLPEGYNRLPMHDSSFGSWLRNLRLKKEKTVFLFNGQKKQNQDAQYAVVDISVGDKDLQQCADAAMRLRAEYLFHRKRFNQIIFEDNAGTSYRFNAPFTREKFIPYLEKVFGMCGSASLSKQLKSIPEIREVKPGDMLVRGGFPGHVATVMDMAVDSAGQKIYLLAQSYMPAQDIHILLNPVNTPLSPWYKLTNDEKIYTPEFVFTKQEWMRW